MMTSYKKMNLSSLGKKLEQEDGVPDIFLQGINNNWVNQKCEIVAFLTHKRETTAWVELGYWLINRLKASAFMGLAVDGSISAEYAQWFRTLGNMNAEGIMDVREECRRHPVKPELVISNMRMCIIQNIEYAEWPSKVWDFSEADTFNGCDLLLSFYRSCDIVKSIQDSRLDVEAFMGTLQFANAWLAPLDGNIGFIVGYTSDEAHSPFI